MPDFLGLMKQATELKSKMEAMQAELEQLEVEGVAGGGLVVIQVSGKGDLRSVRIDDSLLKPDQKEILEDLIVAAHADARKNAGVDRRPADAAWIETVLMLFRTQSRHASSMTVVAIAALVAAATGSGM
jgi:nucleoid-associated protein EbfC